MVEGEFSRAAGALKKNIKHTMDCSDIDRGGEYERRNSSSSNIIVSSLKTREVPLLRSTQKNDTCVVYVLSHCYYLSTYTRTI
jgi:hypothetical protein